MSEIREGDVQEGVALLFQIFTVCAFETRIVSCRSLRVTFPPKDIVRMYTESSPAPSSDDSV